MTIPSQLFIDGEFCSSANGQTLPIINPATEEALGHVPTAAARDVDRAVNSAQRVFETAWRDLSPGQRTEVMFRIAQLIRAQQEQLAQLEMQNLAAHRAAARRVGPRSRPARRRAAGVAGRRARDGRHARAASARAQNPHQTVCGGSRPFATGFYLAPAVVLEFDTADRIWRDEVFGPVVCLRPFDAEAQMLHEVNILDDRPVPAADKHLVLKQVEEPPAARFRLLKTRSRIGSGSAISSGFRAATGTARMLKGCLLSGKRFLSAPLTDHFPRR